MEWRRRDVRPAGDSLADAGSDPSSLGIRVIRVAVGVDDLQVWVFAAGEEEHLAHQPDAEESEPLRIPKKIELFHRCGDDSNGKISSPFTHSSPLSSGALFRHRWGFVVGEPALLLGIGRSQIAEQGSGGGVVAGAAVRYTEMKQRRRGNSVFHKRNYHRVCHHA